MKKILVPIAHGTEEMEAISIIDIMIRAGFEVTVASADFEGEMQLVGSRGIPLVAKTKLVDVADEQFDAILLPGGVKGAETFRDSTLLIEMLKQHLYEGRLMGAICASPALVLHHHDLYPNAIMTCHPSFHDQIPEERLRVRRVTTDVNHNLITSQAPGTTLEFAIEVIHTLTDKSHAWQVAEPLVPNPTLQYHKWGEETEQ